MRSRGGLTDRVTLLIRVELPRSPRSSTTACLRDVRYYPESGDIPGRRWEFSPFDPPLSPQWSLLKFSGCGSF
jgi:hypothetical protein